MAEHPGAYLRELMQAHGVTQAALAAAMGIPPQVISEIWNAKKSITPRVALLLERELGVGAEGWLFLQLRFDLDRARQAARSGQHT